MVVTAGIGLQSGAGPGAAVRGRQAPPPEPTFRTDASFVLTDVFVTAGGKPVTDLTQADFEVREDGVVQAVRSFEAIVHGPQPVGLPRRNPSTVAESNAMIGDPRRRVFVVFLDTYHVDRGSALRMRKGLEDFLRTALGPDDLVAYMTPHMSGRDISFSTSTEPLIRYLADNPAWGVADELMGQEEDRTERDLQACFGDTKEQRDAWLAASPEHEKAYHAALAALIELDRHAAHPEIMALREAALAHTELRPASRMRASWAASIVASPPTSRPPMAFGWPVREKGPAPGLPI